MLISVLGADGLQGAAVTLRARTFSCLCIMISELDDSGVFVSCQLRTSLDWLLVCTQFEEHSH